MCRGRVIVLSFIMGSNLSCYQLKIDCYRYKVLYVSLMRTKKQKSMYGKYTKDKKKEMQV